MKRQNDEGTPTTAVGHNRGKPGSESYIEILVDRGRIDISEHYSDGMADRLAKALEMFGLETRRRFSSPCG